jgi:PTH1 family peptidyl-tRNA hydrolase
MLLDRFANKHGLAFDRLQYKTLVATGRVLNIALLLAKPQTFMNLSGHGVSQLVRYYRVPLENLLVVYDDLDLPVGTLRFRQAGGTGGHKGMRSIVEQLSSQDFPRLRLGIGRPSGEMDPADYVLRPFRSDEVPLVDKILTEASSGLETFLVEGIGLAMSRHNGPVVEDQ